MRLISFCAEEIIFNELNEIFSSKVHGELIFLFYPVKWGVFQDQMLCVLTKVFCESSDVRGVVEIDAKSDGSFDVWLILQVGCHMRRLNTFQNSNSNSSWNFLLDSSLTFECFKQFGQPVRGCITRAKD